MRSKAVVTGSSGFLGRHLVDRLGFCDTVPHQDIQSFDFSQYESIYFLSAYGNMAHHDRVDMVVKANVSDIVSVLGSVDKDKLHSLVFISTSSVKRRVQTAYSRTKRAAEEVLLAYTERFNLPITIIRPLSITGVGEQKEHLIPSLIRSCLDGESIPFVPNPSHDFIDVEDVVDGIITLSSKQARGIFELGSGMSTTNDEVRLLVEDAT